MTDYDATSTYPVNPHKKTRVPPAATIRHRKWHNKGPGGTVPEMPDEVDPEPEAQVQLDGQLQRRKLLADTEKAELELKELKRHYLTRNPHTITAIVQALAIIIGAIILWKGNYYQTLKAGIEFTKQQADATDRESKQRVEQANARKEAAEQQLTAKETQVKQAQAQYDTLKTQTTKATDELRAVQAKNTDLLVERDLLPFAPLLRDAYMGATGATKLTQELDKIPPERRNTVINRLYQIKDIPFTTGLPPVQDERDACLSAALLTWSGDPKWLKRLTETTATYLSTDRTTHACIGSYYGTLPAKYDNQRRAFLQRVVQHAENVHPHNEDPVLQDSRLPPGYDSAGAPRVPVPGPAPGFFPIWDHWFVVMHQVLIPDRDNDLLPDETLLGIAVAERASRWIGPDMNYRSRSGHPPIRGRWASLHNGFDEMHALVLMNIMLADGSPAELVDASYCLIPVGSPTGMLNLAPLGKQFRPGDSGPVAFTADEWERMAAWLKQNPRTTELLARGLTKDIMAQLSHDQIRRLRDHQWITDNDLTKRP